MHESPISKLYASKQFPQLSRAPIVEAVIVIRARAGASWTESEASPHLKSKLTDYPKIQDQRHMRQEIRLAPSLHTATDDLGWSGLRMTSEDDLQIVEAHRDGFMFSRLQPYTNWTNFSTEALRIWEIYAAVARPNEVNRLSLRFINRVELPPGEERFEDYIQSAPQPPQGFEPLFAGFFHQDTLHTPDRTYAINVIRTLQYPSDPSHGVAVILDIDVFTLQPFLLDPSLLGDHLSKIRQLKNKAFFGSITDKALETFQ